jgi:hypothetical protein
LHADISSGVNVLDSALNGVSGTSYSLALAYGGPSSNVPGAIKSVYYDTVSGWSVSAATAISANRIDPISLFKHDTNKFLVFTSDTAGAGFAYYTENVGSNSGDPYVSQKIQTTIENVKNFQSVIKSGNSHYINLYTPSTGNSALKIAVGIFEPYTIKQKQSFQTALTVTNYAVDTSYTTDTWAYITINSAGSALSIWVGGYYFNVEKMVGVAQESATAGNNVIISPFGKTSSVHTSLTPGTTYYVDYSGNITETQSAIKVGVAQSSTVLLLDKGNS